MSKKDHKNKNGKKKGGMGKLMLMGMVLIGAGAGAFWFLAPDQFQAGVQGLTSVFGS
jgi:hypothetical protein